MTMASGTTPTQPVPCLSSPPLLYILVQMHRSESHIAACQKMVGCLESKTCCESCNLAGEYSIGMLNTTLLAQ